MRLYLFEGQDILVPAGGAPFLERPLPGPVAAGVLGRREYEAGGERCEACMLGEEGARAAAEALGLERLPLRLAFGELEGAPLKGALRGMALLRALEVSRFCGACGAPLRDARPRDREGGEGDGEDSIGARICDSCGRAHFPRISPAVIALIRKGDEILLAHNSRFPSRRFGLIAGYVEAGETLEEALVREAREEAGIEVGSVRYVLSQSWPFPDSLMAAFTAEWVSGEARPDGVEITELRWCSASELPDIPPPGSVARRLIDLFARG